MTEFEVELRIPGAKDFSYAHIKYTVSSTDSLDIVAGEAKAALDAVYGIANDKAAHDLVVGELGGKVMSVEPVGSEAPTNVAPWNNPPQVDQPWMPKVDAPAPGGWTPPAAAPAADVWIIDVPRDKAEVWAGPKGPDGKAVQGGGMRGWLNAQLKERGYDVFSKVPGEKPIDWDGTAKRNTIKKSVPEDLLAVIRSQGIELK